MSKRRHVRNLTSDEESSDSDDDIRDLTYENSGSDSETDSTDNSSDVEPLCNIAPLSKLAKKARLDQASTSNHKSDSESEAENETASDDWSEPKRKQPVLKDFTDHSGVNPTLLLDLPDGKTMDYFQLIVDQPIFMMIAEQTNWYAEQTLLSKDVTPQSRLRAWQPTNVEEIKRLFGLITYMGLVKLPSIAEYWSRDPLYKNDIAPSVMSRIVLNCSSVCYISQTTTSALQMTGSSKSRVLWTNWWKTFKLFTLLENLLVSMKVSYHFADGLFFDNT